MSEGRIYRCQNPVCRQEIRLRTVSVELKANPRCPCGAEMKKLYKRPALGTQNLKVDVAVPRRFSPVETWWPVRLIPN